MRKLFISIFTAISISATAQDISKGIDSMRKQLNKDMASYDSSRKISASLITAYQKRNDSLALARSMTQNTNNLVSFLKERDRKQQQAMWTRLGFGILMLGVLIFGLLRKRKRTNTQ
jgi:hypothetical protein